MLNRSIFFTLLISFCFQIEGAQRFLTSTYPPTRADETNDLYHGILVQDPYRWMEDLGSDELKVWVEEQNALASDYFRHLSLKPRLQKRMEALEGVMIYTLPSYVGGKYFYSYQMASLPKRVICIADSMKNLTNNPNVIFDPNELSEDGSIELNAYVVSSSAKHMICALSSQGSDWITFRILDIKKRQMLEDEVRWSKFSPIVWDRENLGFFYVRYEEPIAGQELVSISGKPKIYHHQLGTLQALDALVYESDETSPHMLSFWLFDQARYLIVTEISESANDRVLYKDLLEGESSFQTLPPWVMSLKYIASSGSLIYASTTLGAPNGRLVAFDLSQINQSSPSQWLEIIPETPHLLEDVHFLDKWIVCTYLKNAKSVLEIYDDQFNFVESLNFPMMGTLEHLFYDRQEKALFCAFSTFFNPYSIYRYHFLSHTSELHESVKIDFEPRDFQVKQVLYPSLDGTAISMFILHKKGITLDGTHPTLLYGYGGFNSSLTPFFTSHVALWLEIGGVYAIPNLRGGGEYGYRWHEAGRGKNKQKVFDDFLAAAQWLIDQGYTRSDKLAIQGASNGGLLVGACLTQAPELFGCVVGQVGVYDMLRFHRFTIGWNWIGEYGDPGKAVDFQTLYAYSPLHCVRKQTHYPATLLITSDQDDRVVPSHSFKFAAALQQAQAGDEPILLVTQKGAGHAGLKDSRDWFDMESSRLSFICQALHFYPTPLKLTKKGLKLKETSFRRPVRIHHLKNGERYDYRPSSW